MASLPAQQCRECLLGTWDTQAPHPEPPSQLQHRMGRPLHSSQSRSQHQPGRAGASPAQQPVPVAIVQVLPEQGVWLRGAVRVHPSHVQVIHEVHQPLAAWGAVVPASLLVQRFLQRICRGRSDWE